MSDERQSLLLSRSPQLQCNIFVAAVESIGGSLAALSSPCSSSRYQYTFLLIPCLCLALNNMNSLPMRVLGALSLLLMAVDAIRERPPASLRPATQRRASLITRVPGYEGDLPVEMHGG